MKGRLAVMGDAASVLCYKAVGADTFPVKPEQAAVTLRRLLKSHDIIFVTDDMTEEVRAVVRKTDASTYPIVLYVPSAAGSTGAALEEIRVAGERALGIDILSNKEGR